MFHSFIHSFIHSIITTNVTSGSLCVLTDQGRSQTTDPAQRSATELRQTRGRRIRHHSPVAVHCLCEICRYRRQFATSAVRCKVTRRDTGQPSQLRQSCQISRSRVQFSHTRSAPYPQGDVWKGRQDNSLQHRIILTGLLQRSATRRAGIVHRQAAAGPKHWHESSHSRPVRLHPNHRCSHCTGCQCGSASTAR